MTLITILNTAPIKYRVGGHLLGFEPLTVDTNDPKVMRSLATYEGRYIVLPSAGGGAAVTSFTMTQAASSIVPNGCLINIQLRNDAGPVSGVFSVGLYVTDSPTGDRVKNAATTFHDWQPSGALDQVVGVSNPQVGDVGEVDFIVPMSHWVTSPQGRISMIMERKTGISGTVDPYIGLVLPDGTTMVSSQVTAFSAP